MPNNQLINVWPERFKWRPMLRQMRESTIRQTLHVCVASDTQKIQSSDCPKWRCALRHYIKYPPFVEASVVISSVMSIRQFTEYDYEDGEGRREHNCSSFQKDYDYDELNIEERALFNQRLRKICPEGYMEKIVGHRPCIKSFTLYKVRTIVKTIYEAGLVWTLPLDLHAL